MKKENQKFFGQPSKWGKNAIFIRLFYCIALSQKKWSDVFNMRKKRVGNTAFYIQETGHQGKVA